MDTPPFDDLLSLIEDRSAALRAAAAGPPAGARVCAHSRNICDVVGQRMPLRVFAWPRCEPLLSAGFRVGSDPPLLRRRFAWPRWEPLRFSAGRDF